MVPNFCTGFISHSAHEQQVRSSTPDGFVLTHLRPMMPAQRVFLKKLKFVLGKLNQSKPSPSGEDAPLPPPS